LPPPLHLRAEVLPEHLVVLDETDEFLDEEFVKEEGTAASRGFDVGFAGPSDAPPSPVGRPFAGRPAKPEASGRWRMAYVASVGLSGLIAVTVSTRLGVRHLGAAQGRGAALGVRGEVGAVTGTGTASGTVAAPPTAGTTEPPGPSPASIQAAEAKDVAQRALDRGNAKVAIEQGERSLALDSEDADTWLILGAAYMQRGKYGQSRRCFSSCVRLATRGARAECAALVR
jgi:hypothetical protein